MSVLFLIISALVLIYLGLGGTVATVVLVAATLAGMAQDGWHVLSILLGGGLLALALIILHADELRRELNSVKSELGRMRNQQGQGAGPGAGNAKGRMANVTCNYCGEKGHIAANCPAKKKDLEETKKEEDK